MGCTIQGVWVTPGITLCIYMRGHGLEKSMPQGIACKRSSAHSMGWLGQLQLHLEASQVKTGGRAGRRLPDHSTTYQARQQKLITSRVGQKPCCFSAREGRDGAFVLERKGEGVERAPALLKSSEKQERIQCNVQVCKRLEKEPRQAVLHTVTATEALEQPCSDRQRERDTQTYPQGGMQGSLWLPGGDD